MDNNSINCSNIRELPEPSFLSCLKKEGHVLIYDAKVQCFSIEGNIDDKILQEWALHIRRHYVRDDELTDYVHVYEIDAKKHLREDCIPDIPQIRSGDFAEIIISDLIQFIEGYEVPRYKQHGREDKNKSEHGTDVIAYKVTNGSEANNNDELLAVEVKSRSSSPNLKGAIADAARDSLKDRSRIAMTLAYYANRALAAHDTRTSTELKRFLHASEHPFKETFAIGAVVGIKDAEHSLRDKSASDLSINHGQRVFIIHRTRLMDLIHSIYNRCVS
ncbi:Hachiman antiphage defense system protein HamA [Mobiluncus curtisii]|uniref:Anti-bacteriophage protein A/HamA C-terminal domain-containing protein n=1 Tax=Mobiluncus curtisii ATCC 51333 TaxID=887326 RepID=E6LXQ8_9ACTO|nr:Hachiman antiphage defense system protein HamA [Mobiluncus curtisii]EFU80425.1 hypothetical protein HMPREF0388_0645 [Mobiluncus curtisii ATCC 51333]